MTRTTNVRIAGVTLLFYIAVGVASLVVFGRAAGGEGVAEELASIARHTPAVGVTIVLDLLQSFSALVLAVTLWAITREQDRDLAMLALTCRLGEGLIGTAGITNTLGLRWLATVSGPAAPDPAAAQALAAYLLRGNVALTATFFAVGSLLFSWLLLGGRMIPTALARLGVVASALLVVCLPLVLAGFLHGLLTSLIWIPMLAFEVPLAFWFLVKGVAQPAPAQTA
jgi:Domain of unknown function (DUF4386)